MYIEKPGQNTSHYLNINENLRLGKKGRIEEVNEYFPESHDKWFDDNN